MSNLKIQPNNNFWQNKKVFITGHTGFKGAWLAFILNNLGAEVTGYALAPENNECLFNILNLDKSINSLFGDINHLDSLSNALESFQPDIIFHLAAQSLVLPSYQDPIKAYNTNVIGTLNVFEAARHNTKVKAIINVTSDKCYENKNWEWPYRETEELGGHDPYSSSKACAEILTASYRKSFFSSEHNNSCTLLSVRAGNCIGGGDWSQARLIPDIIRAYQNKSKLIVRNPNATRPWQHVLEPLTGYLMLAEQAYTNNAYAQAWNFGPNQSDIQPVHQILEVAEQVMGRKLDYDLLVDTNKQHEAKFLAVDASKVKHAIGWQPRFSFQQSIEYTINWYKAYLEQANMVDYTLKQITEYYNT